MLLATHPDAGRARPDIASGLRSFPVKNLIIYYRTGEHGTLVSRVLHSTRDHEGVLGLRHRMGFIDCFSLLFPLACDPLSRDSNQVLKPLRRKSLSWLGRRDSNPNNLLQRQVSYR